MGRKDEKERKEREKRSMKYIRRRGERRNKGREIEIRVRRRRRRRGIRGGVSTGTTGILHCVFFRDKWFTVFPLILPRATTAPQKHVRGCESHRESATGPQWDGVARERERVRKSERERNGGGGKANRTIWEVLHFMGFWYGHGSKFQANLARK